MSSTTEQIVAFAQELVRTPSQNGIDNERDVAQLVFNKLKSFGFSPELIGDDPNRPSVICHIKKREGAKTVWLEAGLDTVPAGWLGAWDAEPFSGDVIEGKLHGLGAADCKVAVATFAYLAKSLFDDPNFDGNIFLGFDADEQAGWFSGARDILRHAPKADVCILGYQGMEEISIGARGWTRLTLSTTGKSQHTGNRYPKGVNAIHAMGKAIVAIQKIRLPIKSDSYFWFGSALNIAQIEGGTAINIVPDFCRAEIDVRLVPGQTEEDVAQHIRKALNKLTKNGRLFQYELVINQGERAYLTDPKHPFIRTFTQAAARELGREVPLVASGYGCVGNILSSSGIPIINGFGCPSGNLNSANEWVDISVLPSVFEIYRSSIKEFCKN